MALQFTTGAERPQATTLEEKSPPPLSEQITVYSEWQADRRHITMGGAGSSGQAPNI